MGVDFSKAVLSSSCRRSEQWATSMYSIPPPPWACAHHQLADEIRGEALQNQSAVPRQQDMLLDPYNKTGTVSSDPTGLYVLIRSVPNAYQQRSTFKGVAIQFNPSDRLVEFPLIHRNRKLKQLHCPYGEIMLSHKDPSSKYRVGFFIKGNLDYVYNGVK